MTQDKPSVVVVSSTAAGGPGARDKDSGLKLPKIKADLPSVLLIGGGLILLGSAVVALPVLNNYISNAIISLSPPPPPPAVASGPAVAATSSSIVTTMGSVYPGTGAFSGPPPSPYNPYTGGINTAQYPYTTPTGQPLATPTIGAPAQGVVRTYHAVMGPTHYMDHRGRHRRFNNDRNIQEIIGSEEDLDTRVDLLE